MMDRYEVVNVDGNAKLFDGLCNAFRGHHATTMAELHAECDHLNAECEMEITSRHSFKEYVGCKTIRKPKTQPKKKKRRKK